MPSASTSSEAAGFCTPLIRDLGNLLAVYRALPPVDYNKLPNISMV